MAFLPYFIGSQMTLIPVVRFRDAYGECGDRGPDGGEKQLSVSQHAEARPRDLAGCLRQRDRRRREHPGRAEGSRTPEGRPKCGGDAERHESEGDERRRH
jgi:hypothetical protein